LIIINVKSEKKGIAGFNGKKKHQKDQENGRALAENEPRWSTKLPKRKTRFIASVKREGRVLEGQKGGRRSRKKESFG